MKNLTLVKTGILLVSAVCILVAVVLWSIERGASSDREAIIDEQNNVKFSLNQIVNEILVMPDFLKLKGIVEKNPYHDDEDVYSHSLRVYNTALSEVGGDFITNPIARERYLKFINDDIAGMKRKDVMILTALLHDVGKNLVVKEGNTLRPICITKSDGNTSCPGHEHWGGVVSSKYLQNFGLSIDLKLFIGKVIRHHDTFNDGYIATLRNEPIGQVINDVKSRAEDVYIEALFNIYVDNYTTSVSDESRKMIIKLFNEPELYITRAYVMP